MRRWLVVLILALPRVAAADPGLLDLTEDERAFCANHPAEEPCAQLPQLCADRSFLPHGVVARVCLANGVDAPPDLAPDDIETVREACATDRPNCARMATACRENAMLGFPAENLAESCRIVEATLQLGLPLPPPKTPPKDPGITEMWVGAEVGRVGDPDRLDDATTTMAVDLDMHGLVGLHQVAPAVTTRVVGGSTTGGGFLYELTVGFGIGVRVGRDGQLAVTIGGGFSGITGGRLGFAWLVPIDAHATIPVGRSLRMVLGARGSFVFREDPRQDGVPDVPLYDEVDARIGLAVQRRQTLWGVYAFASHLRDTEILGIALAAGQVEIITPPER